MKKKENIWIHLVFVLMCMFFLVPFLYVIAISFTGEEEILNEGYKLLPDTVTLDAYKFVFANPESIVQAYKITALQAFLGTALAVASMSGCAYAISRKNYILAKPTVLYVLVTMLFSVGMVPAYIINTKYLGLENSIWIYLLPGMVNGFQIIIFRTFFASLPEALIESAKIEGASETAIFFKIVLPLSKPVLATIALLQLLDRWNNWNTSLLYITDDSYYTLQYLLQKILREAEFVKNMMLEGINISGITDQELPNESARFAMCLIATGPMLIVFPFFQKYFTKGLTIGAVKG